MKNSLLTLAVFLIGCGTAGSPSVEADPNCPLAFETADICAEYQWVHKPSSRENGEFAVSFFNRVKDGDSDTDEGSRFIDPGHEVSVKLWMPSMGHGSSPTRVAQATDRVTGRSLPGEYRATEVYFVMGGPWEVWVELKDGSGSVVDRAKFDVRI